ncbi:hypothetical protein [Escherichia coli]|uniref:hypothetical protein n=1 Tax=Escherichia coli TaxID=562 RepID=UPI000BE18A21|nr:hypothetical protein [Escherichia coli]
MGFKSKTQQKEKNMVRTDGFIRNVHSRNPFDVIRADVVLMRMEKEAGRCCGMHFELYQARVLRDALDYLVALPLKERPALIGAAAKRGYSLTLAEEEHALEATDALLAELREKC